MPRQQLQLEFNGILAVSLYRKSVPFGTTLVCRDMKHKVPQWVIGSGVYSYFSSFVPRHMNPSYWKHSAAGTQCPTKAFGSMHVLYPGQRGL